MGEEYLFKLPNAPEEFGVVLDPPELRRLDFSALDFATLRRACVEYIRTYYPNNHNDFFTNNGIIMLMELNSYIGGVLSQRGDILVDESFLPTALTRRAVNNHLNLINQKLLKATPAIVDVEISIPYQLGSNMKIAAGTSFNIKGPDNLPLSYEIFRAPGDFTSSIIIPAGKRGIIAYGVEGKTGVPVVVDSPGGANQYVDVNLSNVIDEPIQVEVNIGSSVSVWRRVDILESSGADDETFEVSHMGEFTRIKFGDNITGKSPLAGQRITVRYRTGGGIRGRIGAGVINESRPVNPDPPSVAAVEVLFRNPYPSNGGTDDENIEQAKKRAPRVFSTHNNAVSSEDYGILARGFKHPVFGSVSKAIGTLRTGVDQDFSSIAIRVRSASSVDEAVDIMKNDFVNRNIVELYVLAEGPNNVPVKPNKGLKSGLIDYFGRVNVLTDEVRVFDGAIKAIDVNASIIMSRNADAGTVRVSVEKAINDFFDIDNFEMGTGFYLSNLYSAIQGIPGVSYVDIFSPVDDVIETNKIADVNSNGVGFNELVILGGMSLKFYFEKGNFKIPSLER